MANPHFSKSVFSFVALLIFFLTGTARAEFPETSICEHCHKPRILVARVRSDILSEQVCEDCAREAQELMASLKGSPRVGAMTVEVLEGGAIWHF